MLCVVQIHATIPTNTKGLLEEGVRKLMAVFMANQEKLGVGPEEVSGLRALQLGTQPAAALSSCGNKSQWQQCISSIAAQLPCVLCCRLRCMGRLWPMWMMQQAWRSS